MKKMIILSLFLTIVAYSNCSSNFTHGDFAKMGQRAYAWKDIPVYRDLNFFGQHLPTVTLQPFMLLVACAYAIRTRKMRNQGMSPSPRNAHFSNADNLDFNLAKHQLWYSREIRDQKGTLASGLIEPLVFVGADLGISKMANSLSQVEAVKSVTHIIPEEYRQSAFNKGKFVVSAAAARVARMGVEGEMNKRSVQEFGRTVLAQTASDCAEEYIITPILDRVSDGDKDSLLRDGASVGLAYAGFLLINGLSH